jgi:hypothetical protein
MTRLGLAAVFAALLVSAGIACNNVYADPIEAPYGFGFASSSSGSIPPTKIAPTPCPGSVHDNGPCEVVGSACEYGDSSDLDCNTTYQCTRDPTYGPYWAEVKSPHCAGKCPDPAQIADGAPCTIPNPPDSGISNESLELQCPGPDTLCACTTGPDGAHLHERKWVCVKAGEGCPLERPNAGTQCLGDRSCDYGSCEFKRGTGMVCDQGVWEVEARPCR